MAIIIEGIDNSGKSTLGRIIARRLDYGIVESEGPPKYHGEMNDRIIRYNSFGPRQVFVRHPCVSQPIYSNLRSGVDGNGMNPDLLVEFYHQDHLFVYCDPLNRGLEGQVIKENEPEGFQEQLKEKYDRLLHLYREWALLKAHVIYRIGDPIERVISLCASI